MEETKKLKMLEEAFEKGIIKKEEYKKRKKKIKDKIKKEETSKEKKEISESKSSSGEPDKKIPEAKGSEKILLISLIAVIIIFALIFTTKFFNKEEIRTIDDLHRLNLQGKLKPEQGYMHEGFSFVLYDNLWYTQVQVANTVISTPLHYSPRDVEDIPITGKFNAELFNSMAGYYVTFDPLGSDFSHVALAVGELNQNFVKVFGKVPVAACDKNETEACKTRPIITCENTKNRPVVYVKEADETKIILDDNCLIIQGRGLEIVRAADKILMIFYGII